MAIVPSRKTNKYQSWYFDSIKAGDKLRARSIHWFNQNKETEGAYAGCAVSRNKYNDIFSCSMASLCGEVLTVSETFKDVVGWHPTGTDEDENKVENVIRVKELFNHKYTVGQGTERVEPADFTWHDWMFEGGPEIP